MTYTLNTVGRFNMIFYDGSNNIVDNATYTVHPTYTEWKANPVNTDWNEWNNWTVGSPYCCTDVVINGDAAKYPLLPATVTEADEYCCDMIHFKPRSAVDRLVASIVEPESSAASEEADEVDAPAGH